MDISSTVSTLAMDSIEETTRQSSKLSLGSSPSMLSADDQLDGDGPLTPTDKIHDDDDDDLSALNSILQAGSAGSLSDEEEEEEDDEQDSASPLSSVPDDFPLSRSASPELPLVEPLKKAEEQEKKPSTRKRRKDSLKKTKHESSDSESKKPALPDEKEEEEEGELQTKRRRVSRSSVLEDRRRQSKGEDIKQEETTIETTSTTVTEMVEEQEKPVTQPQESHEEYSLVHSPKAIQTEQEEQTNHHEAQDDHDYQQRHKEALDALTHIEVEFARLRDKMYQEKMSELNEEAMMIANGTHPELVTLMAEIEEKKGRRIHSAEAWRRHQHANFRQQFEGFEYQANIHFISQRNALRRQLLEHINGKRWSTEDERTRLNDQSKNKLCPDGRDMMAHKREQKEETGELQDIKEAIGFPMAPNPTGLNSHDIDQDLKLLGIHRHI